MNPFSCGPQNQPRVIDSWIRATEGRLGKLADILSAALRRSQGWAPVVNYAQGKTVENWEKPLLDRRRILVP